MTGALGSAASLASIVSTIIMTQLFGCATDSGAGLLPQSAVPADIIFTAPSLALFLRNLRHSEIQSN